MAGTLILGMLAPLALHLRRGAVAAAALALVGGFILRYAILMTPPALLARAPEFVPARKTDTGGPAIRRT